MPLFPYAVQLSREQLERIQTGSRVKAIVIGTLTQVQLAAMSAERARQSQPPITSEVIFIGSHLHRSRVIKDGYTVEDVVDQIASAMDASAVVIASPTMTAMENTVPRADRYGNYVRDRAIFECTARHPRPELYSVIPKGDGRKPKGHP